MPLKYEEELPIIPSSQEPPTTPSPRKTRIPTHVRIAAETLFQSDYKRFSKWKTYNGMLGCLRIVAAYLKVELRDEVDQS